MSVDLKEQVRQLKSIIFNMLNFTNIYVLVLDEKMNIKFANNSLAVDLGFDTYREILECCWLDFIKDEEKDLITNIHNAISKDENNWEAKYGEFNNNIIGKNNKTYSVYWFNSHINSEYNWTFSFGIKKDPAPMDSVRDYYKEIINKDRIMINSMRDVIGLKSKIVDSCRPSFMGRR